eukprot:TRINITY_DN38213_c0_g2_i2.p1 TRINITY_DN38213_c0_g2~~TRINITY_DN38213_c0_g2_i2.p1  ORF type:complete len:304 (-),score=33.36 TRINITY_DN38213_c0_g2_i2:263-1174(-)
MFNMPSQVRIELSQKPYAHGGMRVVHKMRDSAYPRESMVAKKLLGVEHASEEEMMPFLRSTLVALRCLGNFLDEFKKFRPQVEAQFVYCYLYKYEHEDGDGCLVGEQLLEGDFIKFNGNNGYVNADPKLKEFTEIMQAFSHYSFTESRGRRIVVDLQGVIDGRAMLLTDPQVLSRDREKRPLFGDGDGGFDGMKLFFGTHECGPTCKLLKLKERQQKLIEAFELESRRCIVCFDAPRNTILTPCGHNLMCIKCVLKTMSQGMPCPSCRVEIKGYDEGLSSKTFVPKEERKKAKARRRKNKRRV